MKYFQNSSKTKKGDKDCERRKWMHREPYRKKGYRELWRELGHLLRKRFNRWL
jgi:hypothetical protein